MTAARAAIGVPRVEPLFGDRDRGAVLELDRERLVGAAFRTAVQRIDLGLDLVAGLQALGGHPLADQKAGRAAFDVAALGLFPVAPAGLRPVGVQYWGVGRVDAGHECGLRERCLGLACRVSRPRPAGGAGRMRTYLVHRIKLQLRRYRSVYEVFLKRRHAGHMP